MDEPVRAPFDLGGMPLRGISLGGIRTCLELPSWKMLVDLGAVDHNQVSAETVLITHGHLDHLGGIANHIALRELMGQKPARYIMAPELIPEVEKLLEIWRRLDAAPLQAKLVGLAPGESLELKRQRSVQAFATDHRVQSQGYLLRSIHKKLLPEFEGTPGPELGNLRKAGQTITFDEAQVEFAFSGDTRIDALLRNEEALNAKRLVMEVTFLDDRVPVQKARDVGHIHLEELTQHAHAFQCEHLVLTHFSLRYHHKQAWELIREALPADLLERTVIL
ncbi:MAG: MBL fold metallo-hydrolase [Planctomycetota bacterium]|nr:MBL fold metallo-hydrolase [Planctomycetota bacterium]